MGIVDRIFDMIKRAFQRKAEEEVEEVVDKAVDKAVDTAVDKATDKVLEKSGVTVSNGTTTTETSSLREVTEEAEATGGNVTVNININGNTAPIAQAYATSLAQANEILQYLILDDQNNVIGVKDDAPDYIKNAYKNGEFNE